MKRRKEPLNMSTSGFLDEAHDYFDPDIMRQSSVGAGRPS